MFISFLITKIRAYFEYIEAVRHMSELSDRELQDLGIHRSDIKSAARGQKLAV